MNDVPSSLTLRLLTMPGTAARLAPEWVLTITGIRTLTQAQAQNHDFQMLLAKQNHERQLQLDRMQEEATRRREVRLVKVWFGGVLLAIVCGALLVAGVRLDWIDGKTLAAISTAVSIFCAVIMRMSSNKTNGSTTGAPPAAPPPAAPPPPAQTP